MDIRIALQWAVLLDEQRELVNDYLMALNKGGSQEFLADLRALLRIVAEQVEGLRQVLPGPPRID